MRCETTDLCTGVFLRFRGERRRLLLTEYYVALEVVCRILSDPVWSRKAEKVKNLEQLRELLIEFCRRNGDTIKLDKDVTILYAKL